MKCSKCDKRKLNNQENKKIFKKILDIFVMGFMAFGAVINSAVWFVILQRGTVPVTESQRAFMFIWAVLLTIIIGYSYIKSTEDE